jgi:hypothetical protein
MKITVIKKQALPDDPEPRSCPWVIEYGGEPVHKK